MLGSVSDVLIEVELLSYLKNIVTEGGIPVELLRNSLTLMKHLAMIGKLSVRLTD